jgi:hypothetical protein
MSKQRILAALAGLALLGAAAVPAAVVTLPDNSQTTTLTAEVSEQAAVTVPVGVSFPVVDIASSTGAAGASVDVDNIVLSSATQQLKVSLQANAASFSPPVALATTWSAGDVTWNAASWTSATGASGTLSSSAYNEVATCAADSAACSTSGLVFTLGAKDTVKRSGDHTLVVTWKFESI